ncbi:MAG: ACT domain-containing protein [Dinoroseobacter sp.]|nr:ACT domain-containing protein [Dinoroseobacter sp.]
MQVRDTLAMIRGMAPERQPGVWHFVTVSSEQAARLAPKALSAIREPEGQSLVLSEDIAKAEGLLTDLPMAHILLRVNSALDGVGLTAAVASALAEVSIPANVVAGAQHDHVFVPVEMAERAVAQLLARART